MRSFFDEIMEKAVDFSIQTATVEEIEDINILNAAMLAMKKSGGGYGYKSLTSAL